MVTNFQLICYVQTNIVDTAFVAVECFALLAFIVYSWLECEVTTY